MPGTSPSVSITKNQNLGPTVSALDIYNTESDPTHKLGTRLQVGDRVFRYAKANSNITAGLLCVGSAYVLSCSTKTAHAGGSIVLTLSSAYPSVNEYAEGYLVIANTAGPMGCGATYKIKENTSSVAGNFTVTLYDAIPSACATSTTAVVVQSLYRNILPSPITQTETPVGVVLTDVSANAYCWVQTWGPVGVLAGTNFGAAALYRRLVVSNSGVGRVDFSLTGAIQSIGYAYTNAAAVDAELQAPAILTLNR